MSILQQYVCAGYKRLRPSRALERIRVEWSSVRSTSFLRLVALVPWALALCGCSTAVVRPESHAVSTAALQHPEVSARRRHVLLAPQAPPDCEYKGSDADAVDRDLWERVKLDYQQHCYQHAEALVRNRLHQLQMSGVCEIRVEHHSRFVRRAPPS
jgi:hypothetical protein